MGVAEGIPDGSKLGEDEGDVDGNVKRLGCEEGTRLGSFEGTAEGEA